MQRKVEFLGWLIGKRIFPPKFVCVFVFVLSINAVYFFVMCFVLCISYFVLYRAQSVVRVCTVGSICINFVFCLLSFVFLLCSVFVYLCCTRVYLYLLCILYFYLCCVLYLCICAAVDFMSVVRG